MRAEKASFIIGNIDIWNNPSNNNNNNIFLLFNKNNYGLQLCLMEMKVYKNLNSLSHLSSEEI